MRREDLTKIYDASQVINDLSMELSRNSVLHLSGHVGSGLSFAIASVAKKTNGVHLILCRDKEEAAYMHNDMDALLTGKLPVAYYPYSFRLPYQGEAVDNANIAIRSEVLKMLADYDSMVLVSYPKAISENVVSREEFAKHSITVRLEESLDLEMINEYLMEMEFHKVDYVFEPGQFSVRGGIVDVFSFVNNRPYRIELFGEQVESIREFDPVTQLSERKMERLTIVPDLSSQTIVESYRPFMEHLPPQTVVWIDDAEGASKSIEAEREGAEKIFSKMKSPLDHRPPSELYWSSEAFEAYIESRKTVHFGSIIPEGAKQVSLHHKPQPLFHKKFDMLLEDLQMRKKAGFRNVITASNSKQIERLYNIFDDIGSEVEIQPMVLTLKEGFIDEDNKMVIYTDHQIFERFNRFRLKEGYKKTKEALTLKELIELQPGDFVTHIDHGIGRFSGLEKVDVNGKTQEAIRIIYRDNDILYVSIHSLHRISKFTGKDGTEPKLHKLGSAAWQKLKSKTKTRVRQLAFDLIELYALRKAKKGFAFGPDTYLQTELEASFIYEDTPDQEKSTQEVKADMEKEMPMDRLVCGDVGFGKTEIAIRAAFKAVADSKQVAILVPTTVLCFQHYQSFSARLHDFPATIGYMNRFRSQKQHNELLEKIEKGEVDIVIGTHKLLGSKVKFKDLGLMIIDEEQKFGVGAKDKLKTLKADVDTLTLTATPIPRTLQFSLMGARDLSIIRTPPPNRIPVETQIITHSESRIRDAITEELKRGGQVFFVHNRIDNIQEVAGMIQRLCPEARIVIGHGQLEGKKLEQVMLDFIDGAFDVLVSTTIIESGIDIPNANTMIINHAQNFGLGDLHQLRGRVGRSNKRAFCLLITPPVHMLSTDARKRLQAIEQYSGLGSGMDIAMRDLDIRGAGDLLGAEQSGFISDIGFDTYQKILNEAIEELKETEFKELFAEELENKRVFAHDIQLETDLEILLPDDYVHGTAERLKLYREVESLQNEEGLQAFIARLIDRFGEPPLPTQELFDSLRLKWLARELGFEKLVLRSGKIIGSFISDQAHPFYQSAQFTAILRIIQQGLKGVKMYEKNNTLRLSIEGIETLHDSLEILNTFKSMETVAT